MHVSVAVARFMTIGNTIVVFVVLASPVIIIVFVLAFMFRFQMRAHQTCDSDSICTEIRGLPYGIEEIPNRFTCMWSNSERKHGNVCAAAIGILINLGFNEDSIRL